jgi:hypothetical protein
MLIPFKDDGITSTQAVSKLTSYDFVEVVFAWSSFPYANKLCNFSVVVPCILRCMMYIVLLPHV